MHPEDERLESAPTIVLTAREEAVWSGWDVLLVACVFVLSAVMFSFLAVVVAQRYGALRGGLEAAAEMPVIIVPAQVAAYGVTLALMYVIIARTYGRGFWSGMQWRWPQARWFFYFLAGIVLAMSVQFGSEFLPIPKALPIEKLFRTPRDGWIMSVLVVVAAPLMEELFFRGFLFPVAVRGMGMGLGTVFTAALFAVVHASQLAHAWGPLVMMFAVGLVLTVTRARTRSVASSYLIHLAYNSTLFATLLYETGGFRHLGRVQ